jgi:hypothetical protein
MPSSFRSRLLAVGFGAERGFYGGDRGTMLAEIIFIELGAFKQCRKTAVANKGQFAFRGSATASRGCKPTL